MISIGVVYGGPEMQESPIHDNIKLIRQTLNELTKYFAIGLTPAVNVVFHMTGSVIKKLEFEGIRDAKFSLKDKLLMVQVAIPEEKLDSKDLIDFLLESLHAANAVAFHYFEDKGIKFSLAEAENLVKKVKHAVKNGSSN